VISYLTARRSRDLVVAARQQITREWWAGAEGRFELVISPMVRDESAQGDPEAARARLEALHQLWVLPLTDDVHRRVHELHGNLGLPETALADTYHIAYCIAYEVDFLATWNCTHIAHPNVLRRLRDLSHENGFFLPTIVTPDSLVED
jgi:hypothetical protein